MDLYVFEKLTKQLNTIIANQETMTALLQELIGSRAATKLEIVLGKAVPKGENH